MLLKPTMERGIRLRFEKKSTLQHGQVDENTLTSFVRLMVLLRHQIRRLVMWRKVHIRLWLLRGLVMGPIRLWRLVGRISTAIHEW